MDFRGDIIQEISDKKTERRARIKRVQESCPHLSIAHYPNQEGASIRFPRRICTVCGLEEEGSWWSYSGIQWRSNGNDDAQLGNATWRSVKTVEDWNDFYKLRVVI